MKMARVESNGEALLALQCETNWFDFSHAWQDYERVVEGVDAHSVREFQDFLTRGLQKPAILQRLGAFVRDHSRWSEYDLGPTPRFLQPLRPGKIIAIGRNYAAHVKEFDNDLPEEPIFFAKNPGACIGPGETIQTRDWYGRVDHEGEIGVIIGQEVKDARPELAQAFIAGYTLVNDVTARAMQKADIAKGQPWYRSKNLDTFCPIGPAILLPDAVRWPVELDIETRVNGEVRQKSNTRMFLFKLPEIIAHVSRHMTLHPGDLIATGTPEGVGPLLHGDVVEVECPEIGVLRNTVTTTG